MRKVGLPLLEVSNIKKKTKKAEVSGFSLSVFENEFIEKQCGTEQQTSLVLDMLGGTVTPDKGKVFFSGRDVTGTRNAFGIVAAEDSVKKSKTVTEYCAQPLTKRGLPHGTALLLVNKEIDVFELADVRDKQLGELTEETFFRARLYRAYMWSHKLMVVSGYSEEYMERLRKKAAKIGMAVAVISETKK